jgi:hypothetical protein
VTQVRFGMFLAPNHRVGFSPFQQLRDDLEWCMDQAVEFKREFVAARDKAQRDHEASKANPAQS